MKIQINGDEREYEATTIEELLAQLRIAEKNVGIELNGKPLQFATFSQEVIKSGDKIEITSYLMQG